ncbi:thioesterase family protein [Ceratobasidium sp. AG-Ba]|nr:thioesterase family protein [Ceratobasidium sp. AG-Ba]
MAPLSQALNPQPAPSNKDNGGSYTYHGVLDPDWASASVPNGGYVLGLLVKAGILCQRTTKHQDPVHVTGHFIRPSFASGYQIQVSVVRRGSRFTNIVANFIQNEQTKVMAHMIFGTLPALDAPPSSAKYEDIPPNHPLYHSIPMFSHPSASKVHRFPGGLVEFEKHAQRGEDIAIIARNRSKFVDAQGGGLEAGIWVELMGKEEELEFSMLPFFADMFERTPTLLNHAQGEEWAPKRFPTVLITLEFKRQLPRRGTPGISHRTVGLYSRNTFLDHGRHDVHCEIWTAPDGIGEGGQPNPRDEGWKRNMRCIAVTTQLALTVPLDLKSSTPQIGVKL